MAQPFGPPGLVAAQSTRFRGSPGSLQGSPLRLATNNPLGILHRRQRLSVALRIARPLFFYARNRILIPRFSCLCYTGPLFSSRSREHWNVLQFDTRDFPLAKRLLGVEDFDADEDFSGADVQGDLFIQPNGTAFLRSVHQANV